MIVHIVMWRLKEQAEGRNNEQNAELMVKELDALPAVIKEIRALKAGINYNPSDAAYDVALYTEFDSKDDLATYQKHPDHVKIAELIGKITTSRAVVDFEK